MQAGRQWSGFCTVREVVLDKSFTTERVYIKRVLCRCREKGRWSRLFPFEQGSVPITKIEYRARDLNAWNEVQDLLLAEGFLRQQARDDAPLFVSKCRRRLVQPFLESPAIETPVYLRELLDAFLTGTLEQSAAPLKYRGHEGSMDLSVEDETLYGRILGIDSLVTYEAVGVPHLRVAFQRAVDAYLGNREQLLGQVGEMPQATSDA